MEPSVVTQLTDAITSNIGMATSVVVAAGLAIIGLNFLGFVLRKGARASRGNVA